MIWGCQWEELLELGRQMLCKGLVVCETWPAASLLLNFWASPTETANCVIVCGAAKCPWGLSKSTKLVLTCYTQRRSWEATGWCPPGWLVSLGPACDWSSHAMFEGRQVSDLFLYYKLVLWQGAVAIASFMVTVREGSFNSGPVRYLKKSFEVSLLVTINWWDKTSSLCQPCLQVRYYWSLYEYSLL